LLTEDEKWDASLNKIKLQFYYYLHYTVQDCGQTGTLLAGMLNSPQATFASKVELGDDGSFTVERETDMGTEVIKVKPSTQPAVITCDLRLNKPRFPTMPNIMKAKKKPVETISIEDMVKELGLSLDDVLSPRNEVVEVYEPPPRKEGEMVGDVMELLVKLKEKGLVA
jgi:electron transfer flavoprotein beta subunit